MKEARDLVVTSLLPKRASRSQRLRVRLLAMACITAVDASITTWIEGELAYHQECG